MTFARSQKGMSFLSWMVLLAVVAFFASMVFKMLPHYLDYMSLEKIITSVETDQSLDIRTVSDFYGHVIKGMDINGIRDVKLKEIMQVKIENSDFVVHLNYEKREPLIQNLDLVAKFEKEFRVRAP
ncbi:DUF4845 domain-containing protein [Aquipseudomonas guryensis]|jgi:hypothetical protein|uniref:DUF4845 domain-containing protein n=1 Tax=Aquipseudomonas guryensis TaxID=2759165 RepID=A0A7W4DEI4_9GAMM|nr:DUF4845 domain-containing protein [Pseudomonas guryensis]MBB1521133.1 DUF4845 domain-containing protein [Pseudomonas guryensis]